MSKRHVAVLSDVHIGTNAPTNWYQASVHEQRLITLLKWVAGHADAIDELILLGDLVDIWTYPPGVTPPTMADIIAANPNTLGPGGALAQTVKALGGKVTFLLGNHDGQLTADDVAALDQALGGTLSFVAGGIYDRVGDTGAKTTFAHGHFWTMFNAPDPTVPAAWREMPIGHFVTRAFAYYLTTILKPGQTAADLASMGSPNGFDLEDFLLSLGLDSDSVGDELLDYVAEEAGLDKSTPITLPGGTVVRYSDAYPQYRNLFTRWSDQWDSDLIALRAACSDQWGVYLGWFAQRLAIERGSSLAIFGHTHQPVAGIAPSPVNAMNSGYECPSIPDVPPHEFSFMTVDLLTASGQLLMLAPQGGGPVPLGAPVQPPVERLPMLPLTADCSCYVTVINQTGAPLVRDPLPSTTLGSWVVEPPEQIAPGSFGMSWLQGDYYEYASDASFSYNNGRCSFSFLCSILGNGCDGPGNAFVTRAGAGGWSKPGVCAQGHPLQIRYTVS
jgi:hypothetical protein